MGREEFRSNPFRGIPNGLISGFIFGCIILLISLALGMDEKLFIPLLSAAVILGGIIGIISGIGKSLEADENGIYLKSKEYLFSENEMYMHVHTHYYSAIPVTERWIDIAGKDGRHKAKCSFLGSQNAGRLATIIENGMRNKHCTIYDSFEPNDADVRYFAIPAAELAEKIDKRNRLLTRLMFGTLTVLFSWVLIYMIIQDELEDNWFWLVLAIILNLLIFGSLNLFICGRSKKSAQNIPYEIMFSGGTMYIDGEPFSSMDIARVVMTPEVGFAKGDMRRLLLYGRNGNIDRYSFGFRTDRSGFPGYAQLVEAVKDNFDDKFAYDID